MSEKQHTALGIMSGTSLDGLDLCHARFTERDARWEFEILHSETSAYSTTWQQRLGFDPQMSAPQLLQLDRDYGLYLGRKVQEFLEKHKIEASNELLIGSHGHTLYHQPNKGFTFQLGNGPEIFATTGIPTVCDFRRQDIALGGQGAPLVPIGDELLFGDHDACLNLGGFANISFKKSDQRIAFDICPVNFVLNYLTQQLGKNYDDGGKLAASGKLQPELLQKLRTFPFYHELPPKSLGAEWVHGNFLSLIEQSSFTPEDLLRTCTEHFAEEIAKVLNSYELKNCLVTGGGAYNAFLMERIQSQTECEICLADAQLIEYKEALIFGFMAVLRMQNRVNVYSTVTGSSRNHSSGVVFGG